MAEGVPHKPTFDTRALISALYSCGVTRERIAQRLQIDVATLNKHYAKELDDTLEDMNAVLGQSLYNDAKNGDAKAREFWLKTRARWSFAKDPEDKEKSVTDALLEKIIDKL